MVAAGEPPVKECVRKGHGTSAEGTC